MRQIQQQVLERRNGRPRGGHQKPSAPVLRPKDATARTDLQPLTTPKGAQQGSLTDSISVGIPEKSITSRRKAATGRPPRKRPQKPPPKTWRRKYEKDPWNNPEAKLELFIAPDLKLRLEKLPPPKKEAYAPAFL